MMRVSILFLKCERRRRTLLILLVSVFLILISGCQSTPGLKLGKVADGFTIEGLGLEMVEIEPGTFWMGSLESEEGRGSDEKRHQVTLTQGFWMGKYEVTQGEWESLMGNHRSNFKSSGKRAPVENVSWEDAKAFCQRLNEREKSAGRLREGYEYKLPTEAQWEYACRAGTETRYSFGSEETALDQYGWYSSNSASTTHPVGQKQPNAFGLYDMHGNVWEWCEDWYDKDYPSASVTDPVGPASGSGRIERGGSWYRSAEFCRSASRYGDPSSFRDSDLGFRLALSSASVR